MSEGYRCYGIDDIKFKFNGGLGVSTNSGGDPLISTNNENELFEKISEITIDLGPLYQSYLDKIIGDPNNPYRKLKKSLDSKYALDWEFTERDRRLFNEDSSRKSLWTSYEDGIVFSEIRRVEKYSDLRLFVHYHTVKKGKQLTNDRKPQNANFSDF